MNSIKTLVYIQHNPTSMSYLKYFSTFKNSIYILTRDKKTYKKITSMRKDFNIVLSKSTRSIDDFLVQNKNIDTIYYLSHEPKNIQLIRNNHIKHIFIFDKDTQEPKRSFKIYDSIVSIEEVAIDDK